MEASVIDQKRNKEISKKEIEQRFLSLEKKINYSRDVNFYIAIFSMTVIAMMVILLLIKI